MAKIFTTGAQSTMSPAQALPLQRAFHAIQKVVSNGQQGLQLRGRNSKEQDLVGWVRRQGGQADVRIEAPEPGAPRGVLAERGFSPDEVIMSIPESIAIPFEGTPEEATVLLLHLKHNRQRQNQYRSWLNALPGPQDFVAWDTVEDEALSMLQCPEMEDAVRERRERLERVWQEDEEQGVTYSRQELLGSRKIQWDEVQWAANVVRSRNWTMGQAESGERLCVMMPLFDMVNHDRTSPNRIRYRGGAFELVHQGAGIAAGEEITYSYEGEGHELRNDQAALDYCFMLPFSDDSRLFQVDALASAAASSEGAVQRMSPEELEVERAQMQAILREFPTTLVQDRELLASLQSADGPSTAQSFLVEIRAARKAALKGRLDIIDQTLKSCV